MNRIHGIKINPIPLIFIILLGMIFPLWGQSVTTPKQQFGHDIGDDYWLATYSQLVEYWEKLARESGRMVLENIGTTEEGRTMVMAVITSPENHEKLDGYKRIARRMALAEDVSEDEALELAQKGKAVVWIDGGLHATEVVGAQQQLELAYQMVSRSDPETLRILDNVILLALITNPDGMDLVGEWYMRHPEPEERSTRNLPRLYQKYVGHDNNRDFFMVTQKETEAVNRVLYREWFPQIVYNHHQTGPAGCVLFAPPFRDPHSYNYDPLLVTGITTVGNAMHSRFAAEGKPGATMGEGAGYQTWWNGCLRCTPNFHNMIGILTEIIGNPTPMEIPFIPDKLLPDGDYPFPIAPQKWHMRQSIEYSITADRAILDLAAKRKEDFLYNIYRMARNSIERGSRDNWTINPRRIEAVKQAIEADEAELVGSGRSRGYPPEYYENILQDPEHRDPRGFILPSSQPDFPTAVRFINTLIKNGVTVHRAVSDFTVEGKVYPEGSLVVKCNQAFRPHIMDMFEPQIYPDDIPYPGGPPRPPYDSAGYTLAFQMGVEFDRILEGFEGPFQKIPDVLKPTSGKVIRPDAEGFLLSRRVNDAFTAVNRLLKKGKPVYQTWKTFRHNGNTYPPGTLYIPAGGSALEIIQKTAGEKGLIFQGTDFIDPPVMRKMEPVRIGLWDQYGGSMASGWIRWLLEQFEFDFEVVFPPRLDAGGLYENFDVLIFVGRAIPGPDDDGSPYRRYEPVDPETVPEKYRSRLGRITTEKTIPQLKQFLEQGGTVLTIGSSTALAYHLGLPVENALGEKTAEGNVEPYPMSKFFIPGSILEIRVDNTHPSAFGMPERANVYFNRSPVFRLLPEAQDRINPVAWFDRPDPLQSGWARGQQHLEGGAGVCEAQVGNGRLVMFGPEITFRAQPHGTFKFLFNSIYCGEMENSQD
ncbi:MAG: M14 family metallopeptidase [Candidatus Aminicenantes bacterium]